MSTHRISLNVPREGEEENLLDIVDAIDSAADLAALASVMISAGDSKEMRDSLATLLVVLVDSVRDISTRAYELHHKWRQA